MSRLRQKAGQVRAGWRRDVRATGRKRFTDTRNLLAFSPAKYVAMLVAPEEIEEYVDALSTLAVPHEDVLAGLKA